MRHSRKPSWRAAEAQDKHVEADFAATLEVDGAAGKRPADHALVEAELDLLLRVIVLIVQEHFRELDLTAKKLLGKVRAVVRAVVVGADDHDLALEALLAERECRRVAGSASADDDD